jgi:hypothetical protein
VGFGQSREQVGLKAALDHSRDGLRRVRGE